MAKFGVVYHKDTKEVMRIIVPDDDDHLHNHVRNNLKDHEELTLLDMPFKHERHELEAHIKKITS